MPIADFTFDGVNKYIVISSGVTTVDVQDMYSSWKVWAVASDNSKYLQAFRTFGGDPTIAGQFAPKYYFLQNNWRVYVDTGELLSVGTNLYTEELDSPYVVQSGSSVSDSNSDAVVVDNGIAQSLDYAGVININSSIGIAGTSWPVGTVAQPVSNLTDAKAIAASYNISHYHIYGTVNFDTELHDSVVLGGNITDVVVFQGVNVSGTTFRECVLAGTYSGFIVGEHVQLIDGLNSGGGVFKDSGLQGALYLSASANTSILNCSSMIPGSLDSPSIFINQGTQLSVRKYSGGLKVYDSGIGSQTTLEFLAGNCRILTGNTAGEIEVRGIAKLTDNSSGTTVSTEGLLIPYSVAQQHSLNVNTEITKNK